MRRKIFKAIGIETLLIVLGMGLQINIAQAANCTCWKFEGDTRTIPGAKFCYRNLGTSWTTGGCTGRGGTVCCYSDNGYENCWVDHNRQYGDQIDRNNQCKP